MLISFALEKIRLGVDIHWKAVLREMYVPLQTADSEAMNFVLNVFGS